MTFARFTLTSRPFCRQVTPLTLYLSAQHSINQLINVSAGCGALRREKDYPTPDEVTKELKKMEEINLPYTEGKN